MTQLNPQLLTRVRVRRLKEKTNALNYTNQQTPGMSLVSATEYEGKGVELALTCCPLNFLDARMVRTSELYWLILASSKDSTGELQNEQHHYFDTSCAAHVFICSFFSKSSQKRSCGTHLSQA